MCIFVCWFCSCCCCWFVDQGWKYLWCLFVFVMFGRSCRPSVSRALLWLMHTLIIPSVPLPSCWANFYSQFGGFPTVLCCFSDGLEPQLSGRNRWFIFAADSCWSCSLTVIDTITLFAITDFLLIIRSLGVSGLLRFWRAYSFFLCL